MDLQQMIEHLRSQGWSDQMIGWLSDTGGNPDEWARRVNAIAGWLGGGMPPDRLGQFKNLTSFADAQAFMAQTAPTPAAPAPAPAAPAPATPTPTPTPTDTRSAFGSIETLLNEYGLGSLAKWAWGRYQEGAAIDTIMNEVYQRPEFKAIYPEYDLLAKKGRAYSVGELQAYRKAVVGIYRSYGIPASFYDSPEDLAALAAGEVSIAEVSKRVSQAAEAVYQQSPLVRDEMQRMYGVGAGDLVAFFLDPAKAEPIIRQNYTSAQIGAAARQTTFGTLTTDEAQRLAGLGVDQATALKGFGTLASSRELFGTLNAGEGEQIGRDVQLGAAFAGDAQAQQAIEQRRSRRLAEFQGGGGFATNREGIIGVA
jgi:hypothetical protein